MACDCGITASGARKDSVDEVCTSVSLLVLRWQTTGAKTVFEAIVAQVRPHAERVAERVLRRQGLRDPTAVDDAVSLVLDHLRRLSDSEGQERTVAKFVPVSPSPGRGSPRDPGRAFISCLTTDRARDVARTRRRQRSVPFSQLGPEAALEFERRLAAPAPSLGSPPPIDRVRAAAAELEPRQQRLVELLLEGKSQVVIAHVLGVSAGTVSRQRERVIAALQALLAE